VSNPKIGIEILSASGPGILHATTGVIARHNGNITSVEIIEGGESGTDHTYFEIEAQGDPGPMLEELRQLPIVRHADQVDTMEKIYGKRIIIVGGGAQVGQVAMGAILEADRHNIRGEHISIDTIPLVGEEPLAAAVRAAGRLPRVKAIVMAGSLMGGDIENAVVTDPVQAGVMTVMAVADTAKFSVGRLTRRVF
jgi:energy-converting hydrogenase B subunit Q